MKYFFTTLLFCLTFNVFGQSSNQGLSEMSQALFGIKLTMNQDIEEAKNQVVKVGGVLEKDLKTTVSFTNVLILEKYESMQFQLFKKKDKLTGIIGGSSLSHSKLISYGKTGDEIIAEIKDKVTSHFGPASQKGLSYPKNELLYDKWLVSKDFVIVIGSIFGDRGSFIYLGEPSNLPFK